MAEIGLWTCLLPHNVTLENTAWIYTSIDPYILGYLPWIELVSCFKMLKNISWIFESSNSFPALAWNARSLSQYETYHPPSLLVNQYLIANGHKMTNHVKSANIAHLLRPIDYGKLVTTGIEPRSKSPVHLCRREHWHVLSLHFHLRTFVRYSSNWIDPPAYHQI